MMMRRRRFVVCACVVVYFIYWFFGLGDYLFSKSYEEDFNYPLNIDLKPVVEQVLSGAKPDVSPINYYPYKYLSNSGKCANLYRIDLVILVKSALWHFEQRKAIRLTYGREFSVPGKKIKILFFLGMDNNSDSEVQKRVDAEIDNFEDVIQMDFQESYYNMTIKTMMSFRWAYEHCPFSDFYLFTDDDMYINVFNLLKYVDIPSSRARGQAAVDNVTAYRPHTENLFAGYVFKSAPQRFRSSKWRVSLQEYPWNRWPPYVTAGAYVVSNKSLKVLYIGSSFVKHFRFDDIYLGIIAKKVGLNLTHCQDFHFYKKDYSRENYRTVIASHGYSRPTELISVWREQNPPPH